MSALAHNITERVGDTISVRMTWKNRAVKDDPSTDVIVDFAGATAKLQLRVAKTDATSALSLTQATGVFLGSGLVSPNIGFDITHAQSLELGVGSWVYELEATQSGVVRTHIAGKIKLTQDVAR